MYQLLVRRERNILWPRALGPNAGSMNENGRLSFVLTQKLKAHRNTPGGSTERNIYYAASRPFHFLHGGEAREREHVMQDPLAGEGRRIHS